MDDKQTLYNIIAILTERLGGKAIIEYEEVDNPTVSATATRDNVTNALVITTTKQ